MSTKNRAKQPLEQAPALPEPEAAVVGSTPVSDELARKAARELRIRTLRGSNEWASDYDVALLEHVVDAGRMTLEEAVGLARDLARREIFNELKDTGIITAEEERERAVAFYAQTDEGVRRELLIKILLPRVRDHLAVFVLERLITSGRLPLDAALAYAEEANARLEKPGVPATLELMVERGEITFDEVVDFEQRLRQSRERNARSNRVKLSPEQRLLGHLRRMELHELGIGVRAATVLDFALESRQLTREEAVAIVERAERDDLMVQIILISDGVLSADDVIRVARSARRQEVQRVFADLDDVDDDSPTEGST